MKTVPGISGVVGAALVFALQTGSAHAAIKTQYADYYARQHTVERLSRV